MFCLCLFFGPSTSPLSFRPLALLLLLPLFSCLKLFFTSRSQCYGEPVSHNPPAHRAVWGGQAQWGGWNTKLLIDEAQPGPLVHMCRGCLTGTGRLLRSKVWDCGGVCVGVEAAQKLRPCHSTWRHCFLPVLVVCNAPGCGTAVVSVLV